jgi:hypothetical protein
VLNQLPTIKYTPSEFDQRYSNNISRWSSWWATLCSIMVDIDVICHPDEQFTALALDSKGTMFLEWL